MSCRLEDSFRGSPIEFKRFLQKKVNELEIVRTRTRTGKGFKYVSEYIRFLYDILGLSIWDEFERDNTIYAFKERIKSDYQLAKLEEHNAKEHYKVAEAEFLEIYNAEGRICGWYEERYDTLIQRELRDLKAEYDAALYICSMAILQRKILWYMLGILNRPEGFFDRVRNPDENAGDMDGGGLK